MNEDDFASAVSRFPAPPGQPFFGAPAGKVLMEGYRKDILSDFEKDRPRYNPVRTLVPLLSTSLRFSRCP